MFSRSRKEKSESPLIASIRESTIGHRTRIDGTHYQVPLLHADSTASGTTLLGLEEMLVLGVMPTYANTHSEASWTAQQTTRFREDARAWIKQSVGAGEGTSLIFCGSGTTAAVDKLIGMIGLRIPAQLDTRYGFDSQIPPHHRPVVFVGPYEHHSNDLPWRATIADVVLIPEDARGNIDAAELERQLVLYADRPLKIGSFSAASNVTGIISDMPALTALLKAHGAYSCWDCAAAAPHLPVTLGDADALFISPHKLPGGAGTPGVLIVRDAFVRRADLAGVRPAVPGGGTVDFVGPDVVDYTGSLEHREEGGTPAIIESIRAGLAFRLRDAVGAATIQRREWNFVQRALAAWRQVPQIQILGDTGAERVSTVSFTLAYTRGQLVHHNFVVALLNDLFGIQARSGCSCTGPYGHLLFSYTKAQSEAIRHPILQGYEGIKPGLPLQPRGGVVGLCGSSAPPAWPRGRLAAVRRADTAADRRQAEGQAGLELHEAPAAELPRQGGASDAARRRATGQALLSPRQGAECDGRVQRAALVPPPCAIDGHDARRRRQGERIGEAQVAHQAPHPAGLEGGEAETASGPPEPPGSAEPEAEAEHAQPQDAAHARHPEQPPEPPGPVAQPVHVLSGADGHAGPRGHVGGHALATRADDAGPESHDRAGRGRPDPRHAAGRAPSLCPVGCQRADRVQQAQAKGARTCAAALRAARRQHAHRLLVVSSVGMMQSGMLTDRNLAALATLGQLGSAGTHTPEPARTRTQLTGRGLV
ncbi:aminotransferase, class V [Trichosporon asahii var. asahii CBS 2479]|uniref:Aminotransferase, class V n=1 Tax=Trichosporon asahii var. asahii (strain ATCC 90039 / CBS 2479 / JCM 2466 / KCTC 7840 / NBRC 103889/ NCYC 2677 / UAMH 7654) TaxID=1186058 RepID=J5STP4_TRIAS|nr:aminotransferase, class V [Trichosporon asahii var. asahii CBS 2479]EJT47476.1 aminotransferase, class V [Trichosporon asahii var. asahii CBS 2479]